MESTEKKKKLIINVLFVATIAAIVYFTIKYLMIWLMPFVIGVIVAICLQRPVAFLTRKTKISRTLWSILLVFVVLAALVGLIFLIIWKVIDEAGGFVEWVQNLIPQIKNTLSQFTGWLVNITDKLPVDMEKILSQIPKNLLDAAASGFTGFAIALIKTLWNVGPGILISFIFSVVACCYITKDYNKITRFVLCQLNEKHQLIVLNTKRLFVTNILYMLRGYILIMLITFTELYIGFLIVGVDYAPLLALLIAIMDILPVLGTGTALIPWGVIALLTGNYYMGISVLVIYVLITVVRNIIEPKIIGAQVGLPPIVTLIFMYLGLQLFGIIGMLIFPIAVIVIVKLQESGIVHLWNTPEQAEAQGKKPSLFSRFMRWCQNRGKKKAKKSK
ncbi:MAG: sporulation integral membrane protein YtvI [Oscillospiraceae bacterium]|nr:sporulation integral membrane protein YtvI [Oscillospiraceae bacterium]